MIFICPFPSMEAFRPYERIESKKGPAEGDVLYVVTEKVDGANLSVWALPEKTFVARRRGVLRGEENFFGLHEAPWLKPLQESVERLRQTFYPDGLVLYGELYGPGVLRRVQYGPELSFAAFDAAVLTEGKMRFLDFQFMVDLVSREGINAVPVLGTVSRAEALQWNPQFKSVLFPVDGNNWAEGVVVRPAVEPSKGPRGLLKIKNPTFDSKESRQEMARTLMAEAESRINANRWAEAVSKLGNVDEQRIVKEVARDIVDEMKRAGIIVPRARKFTGELMNLVHRWAKRQQAH